jgi:6-phosphogluconate dehydrogenase
MRRTFESYRGAFPNARISLPPALTHGLRLLWRAHTYEPIDAEPGQKFHALWSGDRSEVPA